MRLLARSLALSLMLATAPVLAGGQNTAAPADDSTTVTAAKAEMSYSYPLATCPVAGKPFGEKAVTKSYDGREVKFCCDKCPTMFEEDVAGNMAKLDAEILKAAKDTPSPLASCPVSGEKFADLNHGTTRLVFNNRVVELCCKMCEADFKADPATFLAKVDTALVAQQLAGYPMTTCPVSDDPLGSPDMGPPVNFLYNGRLVRLCCAGCIRGIKTMPAEFLGKLDAAYAAKGSGEAAASGG